MEDNAESKMENNSEGKTENSYEGKMEAGPEGKNEAGSEGRRIKWRLNLFDVIFIACALVIAGAIIYMSNRASGSSGIMAAGEKETIVYTLELQGMQGDSAYLIKPGDALVDRVEKRALGTVVSVTVRPSTAFQTNRLTGDMILAEVPRKNDASVVMTATATVTDTQISIDGFVIRIGAWASIIGPLYNSSGYVAEVERRP